MNKTKKKPYSTELPIIQQTYDLIQWYVPLLNKLPRDHKFGLGDRMVSRLYDVLEGLIVAKYSTDKQAKLESLNTELELLRHQTRMLKDFNLFDVNRYEFASKQLNEIGRALGGWIGQQKYQKGLAR